MSIANWVPPVTQSAHSPAIFVIGVVVIAAVAVSMALLEWRRAARRRPDGGTYAAAPFRKGRRAELAGKPMTPPSDLDPEHISAWVAGYHYSRSHPETRRQDTSTLGGSR